MSRWLNWAIKEFSLEGVVLQHFRMRGRDMCAMGKENFLARTPPFMGDILWEHLEILQKGKYTISSSSSRPSVRHSLGWAGGVDSHQFLMLELAFLMQFKANSQGLKGGDHCYCYCHKVGKQQQTTNQGLFSQSTSPTFSSFLEFTAHGEQHHHHRVARAGREINLMTTTREAKVVMMTSTRLDDSFTTLCGILKTWERESLFSCRLEVVKCCARIRREGSSVKS